MKTAIPSMGMLAGLLSALCTALPAGAFSSLYVFGDGVCTTTGNTGGPAEFYHGNRYCNGRVWVEVLAQWQGLTFDDSQNLSYFGHNSEELVDNTAAFTAPADVATALCVLWAANADLVEFTQINTPPYGSGDLPAWASFINQSVARHGQAVTNLYNKGVRTMILPNAADVTATPYLFFMNGSDKQFVRQRAAEFNGAFASAMEALAATLPGLTIHRPDIFAFFDSVLSDPAAYGLVHIPGQAAVYELDPKDPQLDGPEANYVFWDEWHPSAKFQMHLADLVQQMVAPPRIAALSVGGGQVELELRNIPLGRSGVVEGRATPQGAWDQEESIDEPAPGGDTTRVVVLPAVHPARFYRASFPVVWTGP